VVCSEHGWRQGLGDGAWARPQRSTEVGRSPVVHAVGLPALATQAVNTLRRRLAGRAVRRRTTEESCELTSTLPQKRGRIRDLPLKPLVLSVRAQRATTRLFMPGKIFEF
jgi:hypothetical protein